MIRTAADWRQLARVSTGQAPTPIRTLADRIETAIQTATSARVDAALASARTAAFNAYAEALRPVCGLPFAVVVADIMSEAEKALRDAATPAAYELEAASYLKSLQGTPP